MDLLEAVADLLGLLVAVGFLAAIPVCFLKGRRGFGWFGIVGFAVGLAINFPVFRFGREEGLDEWLWLWRGAGLLIAVIVIVAATQPGEPDSRWERRVRHRLARHS